MPSVLDYIRKTAEGYQGDNYITDDSPFEIPYNEGENDNEVLRSLILNLYLHSDKIVAISL